MKKTNETFFSDLDSSFDFHNFTQVETELPILNIINERLARSFRVSISNQLRIICSLTHEVRDIKFSDWKDESKNNSCFFLVQFAGPYRAAIIRFNRRLAFGLIDLLTGGNGCKDEVEDKKEFTQIDLTILKDLSEMLIHDLSEAWEPVEPIQARYVRTEINSEYLGIVPSKIKCRVVKYKLATNIDLGEFEILYPYSTVFSLRDKLYK